MIETAAFVAFAALVVWASIFMDRRGARRDARRRNQARRIR
jgi:hypothetical protein